MYFTDLLVELKLLDINTLDIDAADISAADIAGVLLTKGSLISKGTKGPISLPSWAFGALGPTGHSPAGRSRQNRSGPQL